MLTQNYLYDVTVIQRIMSSHKNCMNTCVITFWYIHLTTLTKSVSAMRFLTKSVHFEHDKSRFKGSYNKHNLTLVVISNEIYETCQTLVS